MDNIKIIRLNGNNIRSFLDQLVILQANLIDQDEAELRRRLMGTAAMPTNNFIVALLERTVVGTAVATLMKHPVLTEAYVNNVVVRKGYERRGIGTMLMDHLEAQAREWGCDQISLTSSKPDAQSMYDRLMFERRDTVCFRYTLT